MAAASSVEAEFGRTIGPKRPDMGGIALWTREGGVEICKRIEAGQQAMVQARAHEDEALAVRLLQSEGYYDATALASLDQAGDGQAPALKAVVSVTPGKRYKIGDIVIHAGPTVPPNLIRDSLPIKTGDFIVAAAVEGAEANVGVKLPENATPPLSVAERSALRLVAGSVISLRAVASWWTTIS